MKKCYGLMILFALISFDGAANQVSTKENIIVTNCMYNKLNSQVNLITQSNTFSVVEADINDELMNLLHDNQPTCGSFLNLAPYQKLGMQKETDAKQLLLNLTRHKKHSKTTAFQIHHETQVQVLLKQIDKSKIWDNIQHLTGYVNRSAKSNSGVAAANWFKSQFDSMAHYYKREDVESYYVSTGKKYKQPSVVTLIGKDKVGEAIVIGAHIDTLAGNMPGADDDATGISVIMEIARVLLSADVIFDRPVYIIAYAAEERGLVGSGYVVQSFLDKKIPVKAVMQLDQAGFRANPKAKTIWLIDDYVDDEVTHFLAELLTHYVKIPVSYTHCGYSCSDHASWNLNGFRASYPSGTTLEDDNPNIHSQDDTLETINLEHMENFAKLGLAFAAELGID